MYIPWLSLVLENLQRLSVVSCQQHIGSNHIGSSSSISISTPQRSFQRANHPYSARASVNLHLRDSTYFAAIAGQGKI